MNKKIFWIASFPKSGNTLMRAILTSLIFSNDGKFSFDLLENIKQFETASILKFIENTNYNDYKKISDIKILSKYFLQLQDKIIENIKGSNACFLKTHSSLFKFFGNEFTNETKTLGIIYIVRDPRDVAVSLSHHMNIDIDQTIKLMINRQFSMKYSGSDKLKIKPPMMVGSWDLHFNSWSAIKTPKLLIRYEDLILKKKKTISDIINFFEKNFNLKFKKIDEKINNILLTTDFDTMKKNEKKYGFNESVKNRAFFNVGKTNQWNTKLTKSQINLIENNFKEEMKKLNYL